MFRNQREKILRRVTGQRGLAKMWIRGNEVFRSAMNIGKVAAAAAGDENLLSDFVRVVQHGYPFTVLSGLDGAHQACCAGAENKDIENVGHLVWTETENFFIMPCSPKETDEDAWNLSDMHSLRTIECDLSRGWRGGGKFSSRRLARQ